MKTCASLPGAGLLMDFWSTGDYSPAYELHTSDYIRHDSPFSINDPDACVQFIQTFPAAFPDFTFTLQDLVVEDDKVLLRWTATGTHEAELMAIVPTGKTINARGVGPVHFKQGKVIESWGVFDSLKVFQQIGNFPG